VLLALSDGVTDNLTFSEVRRLLHAEVDGADRVARRLVDAAFTRSRQTSHPRAKIDDITAVVAQVRRGPPTSS
jgi:serine/threonine protein phosphatase PrpC